MKIVIDIPETAYEAFKEWHKNKVATVEQSLIAQGTPYEERPQGEWINGREISRTMIGNKVEHIDYKDYTCSNCGLVLVNLLIGRMAHHFISIALIAELA